MSEPGCSVRYAGYERNWHPRYREVARNIGPHLWVYDRKYLPRQRSTWEVLRIRLRWQMRRWRWDYGL